jgi:hypothetical protein
MLEIVPDIAQSTHGIRNIFADIRNDPTRPHMVLGMFLLPFPVQVNNDSTSMSNRKCISCPNRILRSSAIYL